MRQEVVTTGGTAHRELEEPRRQRSASPRLPRALVAEADADLRGRLVLELRGVGYDVLEARTGRELLDQLGTVLPISTSEPRSARPDVIISDIRMPGLSGLQILERLWDPGCGTGLVMMMTSQADRETRERVAHLGADALFEEPFELDDLLTAVLNAGPGRRRARRH